MANSTMRSSTRASLTTPLTNEGGKATAGQQPSGQRTGWRVWVQAVRVPSFTASVVPILVGSALAVVDGSFDLLLWAAMVAASVACQAGGNLANDYYDHVRGIDTAESFGPRKVIPRGLLSPRAVRIGMVVAFGLATLLGLLIVAATGWPILALALLSLGAAYFYTGGPKPLGYVALGEVTVFLFMGPVMVGGAFYVLAERVTLDALLLSLPIGLLAAAILHANNVRDILSDRAAGKRTLANLLGRRAANAEYAFLLVAAYAAIGLLILFNHPFWPVAFVLASVPHAISLLRLVPTAADAPTLNVVLRRTAGLHLRFGLLLTGGLLARALINAS